MGSGSLLHRYPLLLSSPWSCVAVTASGSEDMKQLRFMSLFGMLLVFGLRPETVLETKPRTSRRHAVRNSIVGFREEYLSEISCAAEWVGNGNEEQPSGFR